MKSNGFQSNFLYILIIFEHVQKKVEKVPQNEQKVKVCLNFGYFLKSVSIQNGSNMKGITFRVILMYLKRGFTPIKSFLKSWKNDQNRAKWLG